MSYLGFWNDRRICVKFSTGGSDWFHFGGGDGGCYSEEPWKAEAKVDRGL